MFLRNLIIILSGPVTLGTMGYMILQLYKTAPVWFSIVATISIAVTLLSFASLVDKHQRTEDL